MTLCRPLMRVALCGTMALVLATLAPEAGAQRGAENAGRVGSPDSMPLSHAIADVRRSPFFESESLGLRASGLVPSQHHLWGPLTVGAPGSSIQSAPGDSTFPTRRVFLAAMGSSVLTSGVGAVLFIAASYDRPSTNVPLAVAGVAAPVFGVAGGTRLAGTRFRPALIGSALGFAAGAATFLGIYGLTEFDDDTGWAVYFLGTAVHAAVTTAIASRSN